MNPGYLLRVTFILLPTAILIAAKQQRQSDYARAILEKVGSNYATATSWELKGTLQGEVESAAPFPQLRSY